MYDAPAVAVQRRGAAIRMSESYPFRPWVRSTCRKALLWGLGSLVLGAGILLVYRRK